MQTKTLVLGSGPSALTFLFYNPKAIALAGPSLGGQFAQAKQLGPQFLWEDTNTKNLLEQLSLPIETKEIHVGFYFNSRLLHGSELGISRSYASIAYAMKTRGVQPKESFLSEGKNSYRIFRVTVEELVAALIEKVKDRCVLESAIQIFPEQKTVISSLGKGHKYDTLVSTIPAPILLKLITPDHPTLKDLQAFDKLYVRATTGQVEPWMREALGREFEYVYVPGDEHLFHRVKLGDPIILEYTHKSGVQVHGIGTVTQKGGQIVRGHEELAKAVPPEIKLLGRYSQWKHGIKFHDVLREIVSGGVAV